MSYSRWDGWSSVYVFAHVGGFVECCGCPLVPDTDRVDGASAQLHSREEVVAHMQAHRDAGDNVYDELLDPKTYSDTDFKPYVLTEAQRARREVVREKMRKAYTESHGND